MPDYTYDEWAGLLADFFFDKAHAGEEILFAVDDRSLAEASGLGEDQAVQSLSRAVRTLVGPAWLLGPLVRRVARWRKEGAVGPHPAIPFLALTVLAASRMGEQESIAPHNYYRPLRRLLDPADDDKGEPGTFTDHIEQLWGDLRRWANDDLEGTRGRLVIRLPGHFRYVGLAIQHALVRSSDLRQLDAFFRRIGLEPGEEVRPAELRRALAIWTTGRPEPWAQRLRRIATLPELADHCEALLAREASKWDGRPRDPRTGRPIGRIRVGFSSLRRPIIGLYVQWDERLPKSLRVVLPLGAETTLTKRHGWYDPHPLTDINVDAALAEGIELRGGAYRFDLRADIAYALAYDDDLGAWTSVDVMSYGDRYHLFVREEVAREVYQFVDRESETKTSLDEVASRLLPQGWKLITGVQIDARPTTSTPPAMASLIPAGGGPRIRLLGGLPIGPAHGSYLRGGEPALALSTLIEDDHILIRRESTGDVERISIPSTANREIPLWPYQLVPDTYDVHHGDSKVRLQIVDGIVDAAGPGAGTIHHKGWDTIEVVGTQTFCTRNAPGEPVTVPAPSPGDQVILVGASPDECLVVALPEWLSLFVGFDLSWTTTDAWPDFEPVWCFRRGTSRRYEALLLNPIEPAVPGPAATTQWGRFIAVADLASMETDVAASLWQRYRKAAGANP
jgi:hypothetical protein